MEHRACHKRSRTYLKVRLCSVYLLFTQDVAAVHVCIIDRFIVVRDKIGEEDKQAADSLRELLGEEG